MRGATWCQLPKPVKRHYEKIIVACCFLSLFVNIGLNSTSFGVYQPYIVATPGIGDAAGSLVLSTRILVSAIAVIAVNRFYDVFNMRVGLTIAMVLTGGAFFIYAAATTLPLFLLGATVGGIAYGLGGFVATTTLVNRWYKSGIGTAIGVASVGSGVAGFVVPVIATSIIERQSLTAAFAGEGVLALVLAMVVFAFLRNRPSDIGVGPHVSEKVSSGSGNGQAARISQGIKLSKQERVLVTAAMAMLGAFSLSVTAYLAVLFTSSGFDVHLAALLLSVAGACLTVSKFVAGELVDRIGTPRASLAMFALLVPGFIMACMSGLQIVPLAVAATVCIGSGLSLGSVGLSVWSIELSSPDDRVRSIKNYQIAYSFGGFAMNILPGPLKELTGTYVTAYVLMLALVLGTAFIILGVYRRAAKRDVA